MSDLPPRWRLAAGLVEALGGTSCGIKALNFNTTVLKGLLDCVGLVGVLGALEQDRGHLVAAAKRPRATTPRTTATRSGGMARGAAQPGRVLRRLGPMEPSETLA